MKSLRSFAIALTVGFSFSLANADVGGGGNGVGNGGDPIRQLFEQARSAVIQKLGMLKSCSFQSQDTEAISFLLQNSFELQRDVNLSPHLWVVDSQPTCAWTDRRHAASLYLSYPTCHASVKGLQDAMNLLVHESVHHFGIENELFADRVARAFAAADPRESCPVTGTPFDAGSCIGEPMTQARALQYFQPGTTTAKLAPISAYFRSRFCVPLTGCRNWEISPAVIAYGNRQYANAPDQFSIDFHISSGYLITSITGQSIQTPWGIKRLNMFSRFEEKEMGLRCSISTQVWSPHLESNQSSQAVEVKGIITNSCARFVQSIRWTNNDKTWVEAELVFFSRF